GGRRGPAASIFLPPAASRALHCTVSGRLRIDADPSRRPPPLAGDRMPDRPDISIVIPCLNESASIASVVRQAHDALERLGYRGEVVVCDNGSTDGSRADAERAGARVVL